MASAIDKWVRVFDIPETSKHVKGHTLYKIVSIVYLKSCPDAVTKVTVWKRYNDFKILHRDLKYRHKSLQIEDKFPNLANSSYFKRYRFDAEVINQRKNSVLLFLEYVALHPPLFTSTEFVKFFETSHTPQESLNSNINIIRAQLNLPNDPEIIYSYNSDDDIGHSDSDSISTFSIASSSLYQIDERRSVSSHTDITQSIASPVDTPSNRLNRSVTVDGLSVNLYPTPPSTPECVTSLDRSSPTRYLLSAGEQISKATEYEVEKKYTEAFTSYKNGISILLEGVKDDKNASRRQMVRHKIERYLLYAEKIYNLYLSPEMTQIKNICKNEFEIKPGNVRRPIEDLYNYKVLKMLENGMVVLHKKEHNVFYLKVIQKGPQMSDSVYLNIPKDVPYMVKLFQYYDTTNAIIFVTQYVSGGKLFDAIKQKNVSLNGTIIKYSNITFEDTTEILDREFDDNSSGSSEYSYSELITEYTSKKLQASKPVKEENAESSSLISNSDTITSSSSSIHLSTSTKKEIENNNTELLVENSQQIISSVNKSLVQDNSEKETVTPNETSQSTVAEKQFQRSMSEKSFSEEFNNINYIPPIEDVIKWASQLLLTIEKLHKVGIVISDLDPRNLLLDEKGNLLLTFICNFREKGKLFCNKYESKCYCAPEVFGLQTVTYASDWWSYGSILFELLTGMPLKSVHPEGLSSYTILKIPRYVPAEGKSLLKQLLVYEPHERLGCGINGTEDIKSHPFFNNIDWMRLHVEAFKL